MLHTNSYSKDFGSIALQNLKPIHRCISQNVPCPYNGRECPSHSKHAAGIMWSQVSGLAMWSQVSGPSSKALTLAQHARDLWRVVGEQVKECKGAWDGCNDLC